MEGNKGAEVKCISTLNLVLSCLVTKANWEMYRNALFSLVNAQLSCFLKFPVFGRYHLCILFSFQCLYK